MATESKHLISAIYSVKGWNLYKQTINKSGQIISSVYKKQITEGTKVANMTKTVTDKTARMSTVFTKATDSTGNLGKQLAKTAMRAALVAPMWLAMRAAMMKTISSVKDIINTYKELDMGMRKVMAVATDTGQGQAKIYADLELRARNYFASTSRSIKEVTESMYQLGTAGRSTEEIMEGFEHVMNLAIGTFGDVTTSGRIVAGILNVFEQSLKRVGGTSEQLRYISDLLAFAWKNNQIELSELNTAMGYLASIGSALNMSLKELVASASVMSDALLRGGKGGRLLARSFVEIAKDSKKLRDLGVIFDPYKPLNFYNIMKQLHDIYVKSAGSMGFVNDLVDIFGTRGVRAVLSVLQQWEKFNKELKRTPDEIKGTAEELKNLAEGSWWALMRKQWHQIITGMDIGKGVSPLKEAWAEALTRTDKLRKNIEDVSAAIELMGDQIKISKQEAAALWQVLVGEGAFAVAERLKEVVDFPHEMLMTIEFGKGEETLDRVIKQMQTIEGIGLTKHIKVAQEEEFAPDTMVMERLTSQYATYSKNIISSLTEANEFIVKLIDNKKTVVDITEEEWQQLSKITGYDEERLPILKRAVELRLEELKTSQGVEVSSSALGRLEQQKLKALQQSIGYEILKIKGYSETYILMQKITNEVNKQNETIVEYNKENLKDQRELISIGDILSQNVEKLKASAMERTDIEKSLGLAKKMSIATAKEEDNILKIMINHELDLAKIRGATNVQRLKMGIEMNKQLGMYQTEADSLKTRLSLEREITKEKQGQTKLSSETVKLYEIAEKYGYGYAAAIGQYLQGQMDSISGAAELIMRKEMPGRYMAKETKRTIKRGGFFGIPIEEEYLKPGYRPPAPSPEFAKIRRERAELPKVPAVIPKVDIKTVIEHIDVNLPKGTMDEMKEAIGTEIMGYIHRDEKWKKIIGKGLGKYITME